MEGGVEVEEEDGGGELEDSTVYVWWNKKSHELHNLWNGNALHHIKSVENAGVRKSSSRYKGEHT